MANDLTQNPWKIDTAGAGIISAMNLYVKSLRWVGATTAGHTVTVKDSAGKVKYTSMASGANYVENALIENNVRWNGLIVDVLASGIIYLEYR